MSQIMINDQESLYKNARELITCFESMDKSGHELIEIPGKPKNAASIRKSYLRMNLDPELKAIKLGPDYVRDYYNQKNLRRRLK